MELSGWAPPRPRWCPGEVVTSLSGSGRKDLELSHHAVIFMVEHVAMHHEQPRVVGEADEHVDGLTRVEPPRVLVPLLPGRGLLPVAAQGLPALLMQVHVVGHVATFRRRQRSTEFIRT